MNEQNPYAPANIAVAAASADERATFMQKTYSLLAAGVFVFAATLWAAGNVPAVNSMAVGLWQTSPWIVLIGIFGAGYVVRAVADTKPINLIAYFAYAFLFGLLLAPLVLVAADQSPTVLTQASLVTVLVFSGLTGYVFISGKDFSFLRGALTIGLFGMIGVIIAGLIFDFSIGLWFSGFGVLLFSGFILYDTSRILHHLPSNAYVRGAIELFVSLIMLFQHVLILLMSLNRD